VRSAELVAARNEFESFQVVVRAGANPISNLDVRVAGPAAAHATVYRVAYHDVQTPSDGELGGATGLFPDALVPRVDPWFGETRSGFPLTVPANENRVAWIDVLVPEGAPTGTMTGTVEVRADGLSVDLPLTVDVLNLTLPSTTTLDSLFGLEDPRSLCRGHYNGGACPTVQRAWELAELYVRVGLENRMSIFQPAPEDPVGGGAAGTPSARFRQYLLPYMQPGVPNASRLPGAKLTVIGKYGSLVDTPGTAGCADWCLQAWKDEAAAGSFAGRFLLYTCDEMGGNGAAWAACGHRRAAAHAVWPGLPMLLTATIGQLENPAVQDDCQQSGATGCRQVADVLVPLAHRMADKVAPHVGNQRPGYASFLQEPGNRLWMYESNMQFGSDGPGDPDWDTPYWNGWPGYGIDQPASQARALGWLSFQYDTTGELYWEVAQRLQTAWEPGGLYEQGGNGDGTLFYPGKACVGAPPCIGGAHDIPVESIRLKRFRDSREDYEWLHWLESPTNGAPSQGAFARTVAGALFGCPPGSPAGCAPLDRATFSTTVPQAALDDARRQLADRIASLTDDPTPAGGRIVFTSARDGNDEIYVMNADGSGQTRLTTNAASDAHPAWSPDGTRIAFTSNRDGDEEIWVMNADGSSPVQITSHPAADNKPTWSPDGARIAFTSTRDGNRELYVAVVDHGRLLRLTRDAANDDDASWSPDGNRIVFASTRAPSAASDLWTMASDGSSAARRTTAAGDEDIPAWSNDGARIAYDGTASGSYDVLVAPAAGGATTTIAPSAAHEHSPSWAPDDARLALVRGFGGAAEIHTAPSAGGAPVEQLTTNAVSDREPDWARPERTRPTNDDLAQALDLNGFPAGPGTIYPGRLAVIETDGATKEPGEPNHAGHPGGASVWFRWTAARGGLTTIDLEAPPITDYDTLLAVYTGTSMGGLTLVGSNDDGVVPPSRLTFRADAGTTYLIAVDGKGNATGTLGLELIEPRAGAAADFDGDGVSERGVWRPSNGGWYVQGRPTVFWGLSSDVAVPGDYDGDGQTDRAVWRPASGGWYVQGAPIVFRGRNGDVPVPGDYDGDGDTETGVWRPSTGGWYVDGQPTVWHGRSGDVPVPGDYDGDGDVEQAVWRPASGGWYVRGATTRFHGRSGDVPVPADYDGDGDTDPAVWRPSTGGWFVWGLATQYLGRNGDRPVPAQYAGDHRAERAVYRPSTGAWYVEGQPVQFLGAANDHPLALPAAVRMLLFP
jgi:Tol biopolymer transport system component